MKSSSTGANIRRNRTTRCLIRCGPFDVNVRQVVQARQSRLRSHFVPNLDCRVVPIGIGKSTAGIASESRRRGQRVAVVGSRPTNLLASAMVPRAWLSSIEPKHKVTVLLRITLFSAPSLRDRRKRGVGGSRCRWPLELSSGGSKFPPGSGVADARAVRACKRRARALLRERTKRRKMEGNALKQ